MLDELDAVLGYAQAHEADHQRSFDIASIPSERTLHRVLSAIQLTQLGVSTLRLMRHLLEMTGDSIAIDGKAIRSTEKMKTLDYGIHL